MCIGGIAQTEIQASQYSFISGSVITGLLHFMVIREGAETFQSCVEFRGEVLYNAGAESSTNPINCPHPWRMLRQLKFKNLI